MVVMTESIRNSNRISLQCNIENLVSRSETAVMMDGDDICNTESHSDINVPTVRSIAMSANIARSVREEVRHLIHVDSSESDRLHTDTMTDSDYSKCLEEVKVDPSFSLGKSDFNLPQVHGASSNISYILPSVEENIISAIVLSKWDDIIGPQTVHVWLQDNADIKSTSIRSIPYRTALNSCLAKAVKYVTGHTVNYSGLSSVFSPSYADSATIPGERNNSVFVVPELDLIAQSLVFQLQNHEVNTPFSLALMVSYQHYNYFLHLRQLCRHWLQRMAARLHVILLKCLTSNSTFEASDQVNGWMLNVCYMMLSLKSCGLVPTPRVHHHVLNHPLLERILTSHLQTFGCTVIMGTSSEDIDSLILFLALFLDTDELHCSRFVLPPGNCSFHAGLFLQGLLLNEFGCRELCSIELAASPYPVTAVDLTRGVQASAVKQTPLHHLHLARRWQMAQREHRQLCKEGDIEEPGHPLHESVLYPVKEGANLVCSLLEHMRHLSPGVWLTYIGLFRQKLDSLAFSLLNLVCWMRNDCERPNNWKQLAQALDLEEADLLIVLAVAEKLQPGVYACVMTEASNSR
ncbi:guanine nucleotide exchange factor C9orf72 homolog isoform X2 [Periplaneta americana]